MKVNTQHPVQSGSHCHPNLLLACTGGDSAGMGSMEKSSDVTPDPGGHGYCMDAAPTRTRVATCTHQPQHISDFTTTPWPALSPRHVRRYIAACRRRNGTNSRRAASNIVQSPQTQHTTSIATKSAPYTRHIPTSALALQSQHRNANLAPAR